MSCSTMRGYTEALWWTDGTSPSTHERESLNSWLLGFWSPEVWSLTLVDWWTLADDFVSQITSYASNSCVMLFFEKCKLKPFSPWNSSLKPPPISKTPTNPSSGPWQGNAGPWRIMLGFWKLWTCSLAFLLILSQWTCCRVSFPPWRDLHTA